MGIHRYLIHSLRLSYLREVEDPYGSRIISLDPSYLSNPYVHAAHLADEDRWPELATPSSPQLSEDEGDRPLGFPGAKLKYTQTIMGGRTGGLGLRTHGKRSSTSKRMSIASRSEEVQNFVQDRAPVRETLIETVPVAGNLSTSSLDGLVKIIPPEDSESTPTTAEIQPPEDTPKEAPKVVQFIPKFKGAAEMEERRRQRMARWRGGNDPPAVVPSRPLTFDDLSSEDEGNVIDSESSDSDFPTQHADDLSDDEDFDSYVLLRHRSWRILNYLSQRVCGKQTYRCKLGEHFRLHHRLFWSGELIHLTETQAEPCIRG